MKETTIKGWVARDKDGALGLFRSKPHREDFWWVDYAWDEGIDKNFFPNVKWEDPEPTEVELTIKIKE